MDSARAHRDQQALREYATHLAPHATGLLEAARRRLDELPVARHTTPWRVLLDSLARSHTEIVKVLDRPAPTGSFAEYRQQEAVWPNLAAWADNGRAVGAIACHRYRPETPLADEERQLWTDRVQAARHRGDLFRDRSWYAADGRLITLATVVDGDSETQVAVSGDLDSSSWQVIALPRSLYEIEEGLPAPFPPGVLRPGTSRFNQPVSMPEPRPRDMTRDVTHATAAGHVAEVLYSASQDSNCAGPMARLRQLVGSKR
jgi:hypothetical protein